MLGRSSGPNDADLFSSSDDFSHGVSAASGEMGNELFRLVHVFPKVDGLQLARGTIVDASGITGASSGACTASS